MRCQDSPQSDPTRLAGGSIEPALDQGASLREWFDEDPIAASKIRELVIGMLSQEKQQS